MVHFVNLLSGAVRRFPWPTIVAVLVLFFVLSSFIPQAQTATQNEGFAPDAPELTASEDIAELFGEDTGGTVMQVVITSEDGDVITAEGLETVETVTQVLEDSELAVDLQDTGQGSVVSFLAPVLPADTGMGPSAQIVVSTDGGDVFTPEGQQVVTDILGVATVEVGTKLNTEAPTGPASSFLTPVLAAAAQGPSAQVAIANPGGDVMTSEGLQASLALQQAVFESPLAAKLVQGDFPPPSSSFMTPVEFAVQQGQVPPTAPTNVVKQAWLGAYDALPEVATEFIPFLISNDQDLAVPSAEQGLVAFSLTEPFTPEEEAAFVEIVAAIPLADGYTATYLPVVPADAEALKATYLTRTAFLPAEATEFLPFLSSNEGDVTVPEAEKGLVVLSLTEDLSADESQGLADALAGIDTPDGFTVGYLPVEPTTEQLKQAYSDNLSFIPAEFAGQVIALLSDDVDADAVTASSGLMIVFLEAGETEEDFLEGGFRQAAFAEDLAAADLPEGYSASAFSLGLIFSSTGEFTDEISRMFGLAFAIIIVVLLFNFWVRVRGAGGTRRAIRRTLADTVLTLFTIIIAIAWMQGIGVLMGPDYLGWIGPFNELVQILPILIIGLGVDYAIHMTSRYREEMAAGHGVSDSIRLSIRTVGVALVLATLTTVVGFLTNLISPVPALAEFGIIASVGILSAFILMLTFVPAVRLLLDRRAERKGRLDSESFDLEADPGFVWPLVFGALSGVAAYLASAFLESAISGESLALDGTRLAIFAGLGAFVGVALMQLPRITGGISVLAEKFAWGVVIVALVLAGIGEFGRQQLETSFNFADFLPTDSPIVETIDVITEDFGGGFGETTSVLVGNTGQDVATVEVHNAQVDTWDNLKDTPDVTQFGGNPAVNISIVQLLSDLSDPQSGVFSPEFGPAAVELGLAVDLRVAAGTDVVALYDLVSEHAPAVAANTIHAVDGGGYDAAHWVINTSAGSDGAADLRDALNEDFVPITDEGVDAIPTSENIISVAVVDALAASQLSSLLLTLGAATLLLVINFWIEARRPLLGVLTMLPVAIVVLEVFGIMAARGIPFGPVTATISALAVGIGVPFTIHITHRFLEDRVRMDSTEAAIRSTVRHTGAALAGAAFTTMAGFGSLVTSTLKPFQQFGEVTFWAILFALLNALIVLPAMLVIWDRYHRRRGDDLIDPEAVEGALGLED